MNSKQARRLMFRIVEYHKQFGFNSFDTNCQPRRFIRWYMKYASSRNCLLIGALSAKTFEELDIKLTLNGY